jgi:hypothetical protein
VQTNWWTTRSAGHAERAQQQTLHDSGTGTSESTSFEVDVSNAHDNDRLVAHTLNPCGDKWLFDSWEYADTG